MTRFCLPQDGTLRTSRRTWTLVLVLLLTPALTAVACAQALTVGAADPDRYLDSVKTLTAPAMEGRGSGTEGLTRAAQFLEESFQRLGLETAGTQGYLQPFEVVTGGTLGDENALRQQIGDEERAFRLNEDFIPFSFSSSGQASGPVIFAGYGITAPEFGYDDYRGIDVRDKIVVLLRYEPPRFAEESHDRNFTRHAALITKAINARNHGAKAVVIINGHLTQDQADQLVRFGRVSGPRDAGILLMHVKNSVAEGWFAAAGRSLADIQSRINENTTPAPFSFPESLGLAIAVDVEPTRATVSNVLAYLPGRTDEYVIVGAHYDHLGYGEQDSLAPSQAGQIHPGADDNASGTAGLLELARLLAPLRGQLRRGVLFMAFAAEEIGLLGSVDWIRNPTLPLGRAVAMINMDMIGRIANDTVYVGGVGTGSTFESLLEEAEEDSSLRLRHSQSGYAASDHTSFVTQEIPVLFFFSGLHSDYHKPSDTWEKINAGGATRLLDLVADVVLRLDATPEPPVFLTAGSEDPHRAVSSGGGSGYGPYFGSIPDFGQSEDGVRFSDLQPGSPAARAGLQPGDVLVEFGGQTIRNLYDFTDALQRSQAGDVVSVTVLRDGNPVTVSVTLAQRR